MKHEAPAVTRAQFLNLFAAVFLPMFMAAVDQTLLATATPAITGALGGLRDASWIAVGYLLASATITPVYGRLGDRRGRRNMLLVALGVFTAGSLACSAAQTFPQLIGARALQGLGGGGLMTLSQALIGELVPPRERVRFQSWFALVFMTSSIAGPVIGGIVVSHVSWRWLFLANLPLAAVAAWRILKLPRGERHATSGGTDFPGHILFVSGVLALLFWLTSGGHRFDWLSATSLSLAALALVSLGVLYWHERRHPGPFLPIELLHDKAIGLSVVVAALFASCLFAVIFFLPIYLQLGHRVSPQLSGLLLLPVTGGMVTAATLSSRILARTGRPHWIPVVGMSISSAGLLALGTLPPHMGLIIAFGIMTGIGFGCVMTVVQLVVQTVAGRAKLGVVTSMVSLFRSTGGAAGAAVFGAIVFALLPVTESGSAGLRAAANQLDRASVIDAFHLAFLVASAVAALAAFTASRIPRITLWKE